MLDEFAIRFWSDGYFGAFPTDEHLRELEARAFDYIVKLNLDIEKNVCGYTTTIPLLECPIKDNSVPQEWDQFSGFICFLAELLKQGKRVYIHCKGGHGRSCLVVTCVLYHLTNNVNARDAIENTIRIHNQRVDLSTRWKTIKSPFSKNQYIFLYKFLNPICILKAYNTGYQAGFSASSLFEIETELGVFSNIDAAFQAFRNAPDDRPTDSPVELEYIFRLTELKFTRYPELQENLLGTGIRKIYDFSRYAFGQNFVGSSLMQLRNRYLIERYVARPNFSRPKCD